MGALAGAKSSLSSKSSCLLERRLRLHSRPGHAAEETRIRLWRTEREAEDKLGGWEPEPRLAWPETLSEDISPRGGPAFHQSPSAAGECEIDVTLEGSPNEGKRGVGSNVLPTEERAKRRAKVELAEEDATVETGS